MKFSFVDLSVEVVHLEPDGFLSGRMPRGARTVAASMALSVDRLGLPVHIIRQVGRGSQWKIAREWIL